MAEMKNLLLNLLLIIVFIQLTNSLEVHITSRWQDGLYGSIQFHPHHAIHGWKIKLKFSSPVKHLELWQGNIIHFNHAKTEFIVTNKNYNMNINKNEFFTITFTARGTLSTTKVSIEDLLALHTTVQTLQSSPPTTTKQVKTTKAPCEDSNVFNCNPSVCSFPSLITFCPASCNICGTSKITTLAPVRTSNNQMLRTLSTNNVGTSSTTRAIENQSSTHISLTETPSVAHSSTQVVLNQTTTQRTSPTTTPLDTTPLTTRWFKIKGK